MDDMVHRCCIASAGLGVVGQYLRGAADGWEFWVITIQLTHRTLGDLDHSGHMAMFFVQDQRSRKKRLCRIAVWFLSWTILPFICFMVSVVSSDLIPSKPQCSLASSSRPHPLGFRPRCPLTHHVKAHHSGGYVLSQTRVAIK